MSPPEIKPGHQASLLDQIRSRRNHAAAYIAISLVSGGFFVVHEVQNNWKPDVLAGVGAVLTASTAGTGLGHLKQYVKLRRQLSNRQR